MAKKHQPGCPCCSEPCVDCLVPGTQLEVDLLGRPGPTICGDAIYLLDFVGVVDDTYIYRIDPPGFESLVEAVISCANGVLSVVVKRDSGGNFNAAMIIGAGPSSGISTTQVFPANPIGTTEADFCSGVQTPWLDGWYYQTAPASGSSHCPISPDIPRPKPAEHWYAARVRLLPE